MRCERPDPDPPVRVIVTVAGPVTGSEGLIVNSPGTLTPFPVFTQIAVSV